MFSPLDDRILIERVGASDRTPGGLYIPDSVKERPTKGVVVAVGRGHRDAKGRIRPLDVKVGDVVLFSAWAGSEIELSSTIGQSAAVGTSYLIMRETDLLGVTDI
ncbi:MAG: co-chaperone GroES [Bdellovibrionales bacterium]|nr:co-chaperone GroES [Bdellovibrionales bacterium]